jgi:hypothetical protein
MADDARTIDYTIGDSRYDQLITTISKRYRQGQATAREAQAIRVVNEIIIDTYWSIGRYTVEYKQEGNQKSQYGSRLLDTLSRDLTLELGKGFTFVGRQYRIILNNKTQYQLYLLDREELGRLLGEHLEELESGVVKGGFRPNCWLPFWDKRIGFEGEEAPKEVAEKYM